MLNNGTLSIPVNKILMFCSLPLKSGMMVETNGCRAVPSV